MGQARMGGVFGLVFAGGGRRRWAGRRLRKKDWSTTKQTGRRLRALPLPLPCTTALKIPRYLPKYRNTTLYLCTSPPSHTIPIHTYLHTPLHITSLLHSLCRFLLSAFCFFLSCPLVSFIYLQLVPSSSTSISTLLTLPSSSIFCHLSAHHLSIYLFFLLYYYYLILIFAFTSFVIPLGFLSLFIFILPPPCAVGSFLVYGLFSLLLPRTTRYRQGSAPSSHNAVSAG